MDFCAGRGAWGTARMPQEYPANLPNLLELEVTNAYPPFDNALWFAILRMDIHSWAASIRHLV